MKKVKNLLCNLGLSAVLLFNSLSCGTLKPMNTEREFGSKSLGNDIVYVGSYPDRVTGYEDALKAVKKSEKSGTIFVGFSPEEIKIGEEALKEYYKINPKLIDKLDPVVIKAEFYSPSKQEKMNLQSQRTLTATIELLSKMKSPLGLAYPKTPEKELDRHLGNVRKYSYQIKSERTESNPEARLEKLVEEARNTYEISGWATNSLTARFSDELKQCVNANPNAPKTDIVYWVGASNKSKEPKEILVHELGHLIHDNNQDEMSKIVDKFGELTGKGSYLTDYSEDRAIELKAAVRENQYDSFIKLIPVIVNRAKGNIKDNMESIARRESFMKKLKESGISTGSTIKEWPAQIEKANKESELYRKVISQFEAFANNKEIQKIASEYKQNYANLQKNTMQQEDIAEAFTSVVQGYKVEGRDRNERVEMIEEFMKNYK